MDEKNLERQIDKLWLNSDDDLFVALGINESAVEKARREGDEQVLEKAQQYDARFSVKDTDFAETQTDLGATDFFRDMGERIWAKLEPKLYDLICNEESEKHDEFMDALGKAPKELAILLAPTLVASIAGVVPAVVAVVATIVAKKIAEAGLEAMCEIWAEAREEEAEEGKEGG